MAEVLPFEETGQVGPLESAEQPPDTGLEGVEANGSGPYSPFPYWWTPHGFLKRLYRSKVTRYFDALVSLFSLIAAFVLAVPFGVVTSLQADTLQGLRDTMDGCSKGYQRDFASTYYSIRVAVVQAVYAPLTTVVLSLVYFVIRPGELHVDILDDSADRATCSAVGSGKSTEKTRQRRLQGRQYRVFKLSSRPKGESNKLFVDEDYVAAVNYDFRQWWHRGKWLVALVAVGTVYSIVILCILFNSYESTFMIPTSLMCSNKVYHAVGSQSLSGWIVLLFCFFLVVYVGI